MKSAPMKSAFYALVIACTFFVPFQSKAENYPRPTGYVVDAANILSPDTKAGLIKELTLFAASTSNEIAIATVPSLDTMTIEEYATKLYAHWGIGTEKNDNGILLLIAPTEHKVRIEVGYGLEGAVPDSVAGNIIQSKMIPAIKNNDYDFAVTSATHALMDATRDEYKATDTSPSSFPIEAIFFLGILLFQWLGSVLARTKEWILGGVIGGGAGVVLTILQTASADIYVNSFIIACLTIVGLIFDFIVSSSYSKAKTDNEDPPWFAGGNWGGGLSSGGGFGGFGGGMSGGGGASGSW